MIGLVMCELHLRRVSVFGSSNPIDEFNHRRIAGSYPRVTMFGAVSWLQVSPSKAASSSRVHIQGTSLPQYCSYQLNFSCTIRVLFFFK